MFDVRGPARIDRDRQGSLRAAIDQAARRPPTAASRRLVSIYNGGSMPSQPDHVFLAHPVDIDGTEAEGGSATPQVNVSGTIPVTVLWGAPQVGDLLVATSVGGRWVAERTGGSTTICVVICTPSVPVYGAVVTILNGSQTIASGMTGSTGCITLPVAGTFTVQVQVNGSVAYDSSHSLHSSGTTTIQLPSTGIVCCGSYAIPQNLTLTDAVGSMAFVYSSSYTYPVWTGGHSVTRLSCSVTTPNNNCVAAAPSQGPVKVCYQMICYAGQTPTFYVQRSWSWVYQQGTQSPIWYQDASAIVAGQACITAPPASCGSPHTDTSNFSANPSSASPFTLSGSPAPTAGNFTSDPVGGSIAISA